jgi:predicted RNase H-like nuclease
MVAVAPLSPAAAYSGATSGAKWGHATAVGASVGGVGGMTNETSRIWNGASIGGRRSVGVDGCRAGWVAASAIGDDDPSFSLLDDRQLAELFAEAAAGRAVVAIDVPIGLPEDHARACDREARRALSPLRTGSVFSAPCRRTLAASSFPKACKLNRQARDKGITKQLYAILPKVKVVDRMLEPSHQAAIYETHPEVIFTRLARTQAERPRHRKRSVAGAVERVQILRRYLPVLSRELLLAQRALLGRSKLHLDDLIDAAACLITARRIASCEATRLPEHAAERDSRGLRMEIWA